MRNSLLILTFLFILSGTSFGQVDKELPDPIEKYSSKGHLVGLSNLLPRINNGKRTFTGFISRVQWHREYDTVYFDIGKDTFDLGYSNVSNVTRSHLSTLIKKNRRVFIRAYAGGSSGVWLVNEVKLSTRK